MAVAFVQKTEAQTTGLATSLTTPSITSTTGHAVMVSMAQGNTSTDPTSITDNKSNTYTKRKALGDSVNANWSTYTAIYDNLSIAGGSSHTFTINATGSFGLALCAHEVSFSGTMAADATSSANGGSGGGTAQNPGAVSPAGSDNFYLSCITNDNNTSATYTANTGASWTLAGNKVGTQVAVPAHASSYNTGTGSKTGTITSSASSHWVAVAASYKEVPPPSVALTGTVTASITETDVVAGGKTIILTATNDTFVSNLNAIGYVGGQIGKFAGTTTAQTISFSLTGGLAAAPAAGDFVVITYAVGSTADRSLAIRNTGATDYTLMGSELYQNDTFDCNQRTAYRFMPSPTETQFVLTETVSGGTGNAADAGAYTVHVFRNIDTGTPMDVAVVTAGAIDSSAVDAGAITPVTEGALVYVAGAAASGTGAIMTSSDLTDFRANTQVDTNDISLGAGYATWTSGAFDPAAYGNIAGGTTANSWTAITAALRPSATTVFDDIRDDIRDGVDSAQSEGTGWDALKSTTMPVANVVRTSPTVVTITLAAAATYNITAQETITATVPAAALVGAGAVVASPTFTIATSGSPSASISPSPSSSISLSPSSSISLSPSSSQSPSSSVSLSPSSSVSLSPSSSQSPSSSISLSPSSSISLSPSSSQSPSSSISLSPSSSISLSPSSSISLSPSSSQSPSSSISLSPSSSISLSPSSSQSPSSSISLSPSSSVSLSPSSSQSPSSSISLSPSSSVSASPSAGSSSISLSPSVSASSSTSLSPSLSPSSSASSSESPSTSPSISPSPSEAPVEVPKQQARRITQTVKFDATIYRWDGLRWVKARLLTANGSWFSKPLYYWDKVWKSVDIGNDIP